MMDTRVKSDIETYQRCLHEETSVPSTIFGHAKLYAEGVANKLFIAFLFSDPDIDVHFLKDQRLILSSTVFTRRPKLARSVTSHTTET